MPKTFGLTGRKPLTSLLSKFSAVARYLRGSKTGGEGGRETSLHPDSSGGTNGTKMKMQNGWLIPERYTLLKALGSGAYGSVMEAKDTQTGKYVAIKRIQDLFMDDIDCKRVLREIAIMSRLNHDNIVRICEIPLPGNWKTFQEIYIVMEACDTDLKKLLKQDVNLTIVQILTILYKILCGLKYLHSANIYHRDLKPANCLANQDCSVKICDFGLSRALGEEDSNAVKKVPSGGGRKPRAKKRCLTSHVVTRWYRAPELILAQDNYTEAIDTWSAGCIFAELLGMLKGTLREHRGPLFKGSSCVLLSPKGDEDDSDPNKIFQPDKITNDQLAMILNILGTPGDDEINHLQHEEAKRYIRCFQQTEGTGFRTARFKLVDNACLDLMEALLRFGPERRIRVNDALAHEVFVRETAGHTIRTPALEQVYEKEPFSFGFEKEPVLDQAKLRAYYKSELTQMKEHTQA